MKKYSVALWLALLVMFTAATEIKAAQKVFYESSNASQLTVVNFHHFGHANEYEQIENIRTHPQRFKDILRILKKNGYTTITQQQAIAYLKGTGRIPKKSILLTIDDGYESTYEYAYPALKEMNMVATLYPIIAEIERGHRMNVPTASWQQIAEMANSGHIEIGNHTYDLHWRDKPGREAMIINQTKQRQPLTTSARKTYIMDDALQAEAIFEEKTGLQMGKTFSYPYGAYDQVAIQAIKALGYKAAYTVETGYNLFGSGADNMYKIKRIGVANNTKPEQLLAYLKRNELAAQKELKRRELRVAVNFNEKSKQLRLTAIATKGAQSIKSLQFEVYRNENGLRTKVGAATVPQARAYNSKSGFVFTEKLIQNKVYSKYGKGGYSMKIILTNKRGQSFIEWINYTYK